MNRREFLGAAAAGVLAPSPAAAAPAADMGLLLYSFGHRARQDARFREPARFLEFARGFGATAVQLPLGMLDAAGAAAVRLSAERSGMAVEAIVSPPGKAAAERERFAAELRTAKDCGADVARTVMLGGRRYEAFDRSADYADFDRRARASLERAEPVAGRAGVRLAVENHKDYRTDELVGLLEHLSSEWVGACLDTGNSLALLEDPGATVAGLAPHALTVHLKDIDTEESADGFLMSEVPLGRGRLDLAALVGTVRKANPRARFQLEMITRDPLSIPCLTERYWATMGRVPGRELARALSLVRREARGRLPRVGRLTDAERLAVEEANVRDSFAHGARAGLIPAG